MLVQVVHDSIQLCFVSKEEDSIYSLSVVWPCNIHFEHLVSTSRLPVTSVTSHPFTVVKATLIYTVIELLYSFQDNNSSMLKKVIQP